MWIKDLRYTAGRKRQIRDGTPAPGLHFNGIRGIVNPGESN